MLRIISLADSCIYQNHQKIVTWALLIVFVYLILYAFGAPGSKVGPDGRGYELKGYNASQAESLFGKGNFSRCYWSPGMIASIGTLYKYTGRKPIAIRIFIAYSAILCGYLIYLIALDLGGPLAGILAPILFLVSKPVHEYIIYLQYEIPVATIIVISIYLMVFYRNRTTAGNWISLYATPIACGLVAGLIFGWGILMTSRIVAFAPLIAISTYSFKNKKVAWIKITGYSLGILMILVPWTVRNFMYYDEFIPLTTNGGINLYIGNNPLATNGYFLPDKEIRPPYKHSESAKWVKFTIDYMSDNPVLTTKRFISRFFLFWKPEFTDQYYYLAAFLVGLFRLRHLITSSDKRVIAVAFGPLLMSIVHMPFFIQWRYILPVLPLICIVAAVGICGVRNQISSLNHSPKALSNSEPAT